jgi:hypothetical protein
MAEKINLDTDLKPFVGRVLDEFPVECVKNRGRLCGRVTTALARAEHAYNFGMPEEQIMERVGEAVDSVNERCEGITISEDGRTTCGLTTTFHPNFRPAGE